ncbi:MAG: M20/M25/M40 family metallo-hydrolase [Bacteroidales bacterium]|nr:M20/M25/M40 family metallo-hydrolase [Bacteroidales bacterium]
MISLLQKLIAIPSLSRDEGAVADFLENWLREEGLAPHRCGNNLWCCHGSGPAVLLDAHIDTVKPVAGWTRDPFTPSLEGGRLYGLGSNDDGASVVALIAAYKQLCAKPQPYTLILSLSAEEETSGRKGLEISLPEMEAACGPIAFGVFGEPTSLEMAVAEKGLMVLDCTVEGVAGHAARNNGVNAIYKALDAIEWFRSKQFEKVSPLLGPVKMTVTQIQAGTQHNVIPDLCSFVVDIRSNGLYTNEELLALIQAEAPCQAVARSTRLCGSSIAEDHPLVKRAQALGIPTVGSPTLSNQALCRFPSVKMGPGDSVRSHTADEYVEVADISKATELYVRLLDGLKI